MTARPVAYVRRSTAGESNPGDTSREVQEQAIRDLAHRDGHNGNVQIYTDWGRSGDEAKLGKRTAYTAMMKAVAKGEVSVIYAYALDRLHRSVIETGKMMAAIRDHRVPIITRLEGEITDEDPIKWMLVTQLAAASEFQLRVMKRRAHDNIKRRRAREDDFGVAPYGKRVDRDTHRFVDEPSEDVTAVVEAYERTGSFAQAAKLLNTDDELRRRAPARRGTFWADTTVARILRRSGHSEPSKRQGWSPSRAPDDFALYRLLVCPHDGGRLTAQRSKSGNGRSFARYFCSRARWDPTHPRPYAVAESIVLPWVRERVEGVRGDREAVDLSLGSGAERRAELEEDRRRAGAAYLARAITDEEFAATIARIEEELEDVPEELDQYTFSIKLSGRKVRFDAEPADLGADLRGVVDHVVLDATMRPIDIGWRTGT